MWDLNTLEKMNSVKKVDNADKGYGVVWDKDSSYPMYLTKDDTWALHISRAQPMTLVEAEEHVLNLKEECANAEVIALPTA